MISPSAIQIVSGNQDVSANNVNIADIMIKHRFRLMETIDQSDKLSVFGWIRFEALHSFNFDIPSHIIEYIILHIFYSSEVCSWLIRNKVDDKQIENYLTSRSVTLTEIIEFTDQDLTDLIKDIERINKHKIQIIDKKRFIQACTALRPAPSQPQQIISPVTYH